MSRVQKLEQWWKAESTRHFLWLPVYFAAGIALYYHLPEEPPLWLLPTQFLVMLAFALTFRPIHTPIMVGILAFLFGAAYADIRAYGYDTIILHEALSPRPVEGTVRDIERTQNGVRLWLKQVTVDGLSAEETPAQIRLSVRIKKGREFELPPVGSTVNIRAGLMPPMGPALPNGFDFARYFYFANIGAVGYGLPPWKVVALREQPTIADRFWSWRANLTDRIVKTLGEETGGIAAGLITGDARAIREEDFNSLRASNLYHIIAISGEHMMVIAGVIFFSLRSLLLLMPARIALRPEGKPIVAAISLVLVTIYLFVTGLPMSAVRAWVMIVLLLLSVIFRRTVDPLRSLSVAALLILLYDPASLHDPGFQLSFAATLAILALVDSPLMRALPAIERGPIRSALYWLRAMVLVSVVAEAATMPLVISMFNNVSPYGVFANALATPLVSLFLMPVVALFFILLPLGLTDWALWLLKQGILALMGLSQWVASFPHAQLFSPSLPGWGVACFAFGLLWICLWQTRVRRYGVIPAIIGVMSLLTVHSPDMLVSNTLKQIAFRTDDGYVLARGRTNSMIAELWANGLGYKELKKASEPEWICDDAKNCVAGVMGRQIALPKEDKCAGDIVITSNEALRCANAKVIGPKQLAAGSVTALWLANAPRTENSGDWQGKRPWSVGIIDEASDE